MRHTNYFLKRKTLLLLMLLLSIQACKKEESDNVIIPSKTPINTSVTKLSSLLTVKHIIPLETNDQSLIGGEMEKILKHGGHYYVSFGFNTLLQFDEQGKFVRKIGAVGQGPGEYTMLTDFDVADSGVYLKDYMKLQQYTHNGEFVRTIPFDVNICGIEVVGDKILGHVTREKNISYIFDLNGKPLDNNFPASNMSIMRSSSYYWPYRDGKYLFPFYLCSETLVYDTRKEEYSNVLLTDLPGMMTLELGNRLWEEQETDIDLREYATYVWPFNSNGKQLYFMTHESVKDPGTLWLKKIEENENFAYSCKQMDNDITFIPVVDFFSCFTRSEDSFLSFIMPYQLKEAIETTKDSDSPYYKQMKALADSLTEEDNYIIIEYEFK